MKTYEVAPEEVQDRVIALIRRFYPDHEKVGLRVDLLMVSTDTEDTPALTHGGYPAAAVVRIVNSKDRANDLGDAEIVIDREQYEDMSSDERDALLDHELYHLDVVKDRRGFPKRDEHGRPKLKMRKHDFQVGWFHEIARRHGPNSGEVQQAARFIDEQGQVYFSFAGEVMQSLVPKVRLAKLRPDGVESVTITHNGEGVKIDKDGVHAIAKAEAAA